jgi:hypothetical protein
MRRTVHLDDLADMHPNLVWGDIGAAAVAVFMDRHGKPPFRFDLSIEEVPGFPDELLSLSIHPGKVAAENVNSIRRTHEPTRLVEMAAIAIAGLGLYHAGEHHIRDVALPGSGADYLVDEENDLLEIAGRSRRSDFEAAWRQKWQRLNDNADGGFYVCVAEFETSAGRLAFQE